MKKLIYLLITVINTVVCENYISKYCDGPNLPNWRNNNKYFTRIMDQEVYLFQNIVAVIPCCVNLALNKTKISWYYSKKNSKILVNDTNQIKFKIYKDDRFLLPEFGSTYIDNFTCEFSNENGNKINHTTRIEATFNKKIISVQDINGEPFVEGQIKVGEKNIERWCTIFTNKNGTQSEDENVFWYRTDNESNVIPLKHEGITITKYPYSYGSAIGSLLKIDVVTPDLLGFRIACRHSIEEGENYYYFDIKPGDLFHHCVQWFLEHILPVLIIILIILIIIGYFHLEIRLIIKDKFYPIEEPDDKKWDVYICYGADTRELIKNCILPCLKSRGYKCYVWEETEYIGSYLPTSFQHNLELSRRFFMVFSEALINDSLLIQLCELAVNTKLSSKLQITTLVPPNFKKLKGNIPENASVIKLILNTCKQIKIPKCNNKKKCEHPKFSRQLYLVMPPLRDASNENNQISYFV